MTRRWIYSAGAEPNIQDLLPAIELWLSENGACSSKRRRRATTVPRSAVHFGTCYVGSRKKAETHKRAAVGAAAGSRKKRKAVAPVITISFDDDSVVADDE